MLASSGLTALATNGDAAVTAIAATGGGLVYEATIVNTGSTPGFWSIGGNVWMYLPGGASVTVNLRHMPVSGAVMIKRVDGGADMTGVYAWTV